MKPIHIKRLRKLIAFLRKLPRKRFNFAIVRNEPPKCGAVGCAIGYMPNVFPRVFKSMAVESEPWTHSVGFRGKNEDSFTDVAEWVSGESWIRAQRLFSPGTQSLVEPELQDLSCDATPQAGRRDVGEVHQTPNRQEMSTEGPHYGNEALAYNDAENWRAFCESERIDAIIGWAAVWLIACVLCFLL